MVRVKRLYVFTQSSKFIEWKHIMFLIKREWLTYTQDLVTTTQKIVTGTQIPFFEKN